MSQNVSPQVTLPNKAESLFPSFEKWRGKKIFCDVAGYLDLHRKEGPHNEWVEEVGGTAGEAATVEENIFERIFEVAEIMEAGLEELSIYVYDEDNFEGTLEEFKLIDEWEEVRRIGELTNHWDTAGIEHKAPYQHDILKTDADFESMQNLINEAIRQGYGLKSSTPLPEPFSCTHNLLDFNALLARRFVGLVEGWSQEKYEIATSMWNRYAGIPVHPDDKVLESE